MGLASVGQSRAPLAGARSAVLDLTVETSLAAIEADWRDLELRAAGTPFQRFDFCDAWLRHIGPCVGARPVIVTGRHHGRLVAVLPFSAEKFGPVTIARFIGGSHATQNTGLFDREILAGLAPGFADRAAAALRTAENGADLLLLTYQPAKIDGEPNPLVGDRSRPAPHFTYEVSLEGGFERVLERHHGSKKKRRVRNAARGFEGVGGYVVRRAETHSEASEVIRAFLHQKAARFAEQGLPNVFAEPGTPAFLADLALRSVAQSRSGAPPIAHVYALRHAEGIGATGLVLAFDGTAHLAVNSFALDGFAKYGPGEVLLFHAIENAAEQGLTRFDFGIGSARYKDSWSDREAVLHETAIAVTTAGAAAAAATAVARKAADTVRRNPRIHSLVQRLRRSGFAVTETRDD